MKWTLLAASDLNSLLIHVHVVYMVWTTQPLKTSEVKSDLRIEIGDLNYIWCYES